MKRFITYCSIFLFTLIIGYGGYYAYESYHTRLPQADIYVWGDSRMYWGLNMEQLQNELGKQVVATQQEGASVYDMLVMVDRVPKQTTCIVGLSECVLFRNPKSDYNRSGFNIWAIGQMLRLPKYSCSQIHNIIKLNKWRPKYVETTRHDYFEYYDTIATPEPMLGWITEYNDPKPYFEAKSQAYQIAIRRLIKKNCRVILLDFPPAEQVELMAQSSPNRPLTENFVKELMTSYRLNGDTLILDSPQRLHYDLSHLNKIGASMVSTILSDKLLNSEDNSYMLIKINY